MKYFPSAQCNDILIQAHIEFSTLVNKKHWLFSHTTAVKISWLLSACVLNSFTIHCCRCCHWLSFSSLAFYNSKIKVAAHDFWKCPLKVNNTVYIGHWKPVCKTIAYKSLTLKYRHISKRLYPNIKTWSMCHHKLLLIQPKLVMTYLLLIQKLHKDVNIP